MPIPVGRQRGACCESIHSSTRSIPPHGSDPGTLHAAAACSAAEPGNRCTRLATTCGGPGTVAEPSIIDYLGKPCRCDRKEERVHGCLLYTSPSPRDRTRSRMPS